MVSIPMYRSSMLMCIFLFLPAGCGEGVGALGFCDGVECSGRGACITRNGQPYCSCDAGFHPRGLACVGNDRDDPCLGVGCNDHGSCVLLDDLPRCECEADYEPDESAMLCLGTGAPERPFVPASCSEVGSVFDGPAMIDADHDGPSPPFQVYCDDMDSAAPLEYLTLPSTTSGGNYSEYVHSSGATVRCRYEKVRLADLQTLRVDGSDQRHATCEPDDSDHASHARWGRAEGCRCDGCDQGSMRIDLSGTPFVLDLDGRVEFETSAEGGVTIVEEGGRVVEARASGSETEDCGWTAAAEIPGLVLRFQGE